jgi:hypothetical protein
MLTWKSQTPPLPDAVLAAAELILGVRLPDAYKSVAQQWPHGSPMESDFTVRGGTLGTWRSCVGCILSLDPRHSDNVYSHVGDGVQPAGLPAGVIPIIDDGGGDLVCLDYRTAAEPRVVYWAHEVGGVEGIVPVADSFVAFLELLAAEGTPIEDRA